MAEANNKVPITKKHRQAPEGNGETPEDFGQRSSGTRDFLST